MCAKKEQCFRTYPDLEGRTPWSPAPPAASAAVIAQALLQQRVRVSAQHRTQSPPPSTFPVQADLGTERGCVEAVRAAHQKLGTSISCVHRRGIYNAAADREHLRSRSRRCSGVNAFSAFYLCGSCSLGCGNASSSSAAPAGQPRAGAFALVAPLVSCANGLDAAPLGAQIGLHREGRGRRRLASDACAETRTRCCKSAWGDTAADAAGGAGDQGGAALEIGGRSETLLLLPAHMLQLAKCWPR